MKCLQPELLVYIYFENGIKDAGKEWIFVEDLQAVNAPVHAQAPNVPNPHTILSQVPTESVVSSQLGLSC